MTKVRKTHVHRAVTAAASIDPMEPGGAQLDIYSVDDEFHFVMPRATLERLSRQISALLRRSSNPVSAKRASEAAGLSHDK